MDSKWTIRHLATCKSDRSSKILFPVFAVTLEAWAVEKPVESVGTTCLVLMFRKTSKSRF